MAGAYDPDPLTFASPSIGSPETINNCSAGLGGNNMPDDPLRTENILAALLWDIMDAAQDDDTAFNAGIVDELAMGTNEILHVADTWLPMTPEQFLFAFAAEYPQIKRQLWATAMNNGYNIDDHAPGIVGNLGSPSHQLNVESSDVSIDFTWTSASDDMSGIAGYSVAMSAASGILPDTVQDIGDVTSFNTGWTVPGTWWFGVRAVDRAGRWSANAAWSGPYVIHEPTPPDMNLTIKPSTWQYQLIPRMSADAVQSGVSAPALLVGDTSTYFNLVLYNSGELSTLLDWWYHSVMLDGEHIWGPFISPFTGPLNGQSYAYYLNGGATVVRGGRHCVSAFADHTEDYVEDFEDDNRFAKQWAWYTTPFVTAGNLVTRSAPPDPTGGLLNPGGLTSYNCDGYSVSHNTTDRFLAAYIVPSNLADDYDLRLHDYVESVHTAWTIFNQYGWSAREPGRIDAVLVDVADFPGPMYWHLGIVNMNGGAGEYQLHYIKSAPLALGVPVVVDLPANRYMALRDVFVGTADLGPLTIDVDVDPAAGPVQVAWFDATFQRGELLDHTASATTDSSGRATLSLTTNWNGYYGLAVYRDPIDQPVGKTPAAVDVTIHVRETPPDLAPIVPANWVGSIVPSPVPLLATMPAVAPSSLAGNASTTYVNAALANVGPTYSNGVVHMQYLDGVPLEFENTPGILPGVTLQHRGQTAHFVRGGRHMLSTRIDSDQLVAEISDTNNAAARQWVWSPLALTLGEMAERPMPPAATGGFGDLAPNATDPAGLNCDGLRLPAPATNAVGDGYFHGIAVMPGPGSDVDVRLHPASSGVDNGFDTVVAASGWGVGESDYVLGNFHQLAAAAWDVGVVAQSGNEKYQLQQVSSVFLAMQPHGPYGPFTMRTNEIVQLYEVKLESGSLSIGVEARDASVDWGFTLHPRSVAYLSKSVAVAQGLAYLDPAGQTDYVTLQVPADGTYCLAVWKAQAVDLEEEGAYTIHFYRDATDAPNQATQTRIRAVQPNPFNPRTTIVFELASQQRVDLAIYDLRGRFVRQLLAEGRGAGSHAATWNGIDASGRRVATGVYIVRLVAGGVVKERKIVLVK
jgi:hypothetical protein